MPLIQLTTVEKLRHDFRGVVERVFLTNMGVIDTQLTDYLAELLSRLIRMDNIFRLRDAMGRRLWQMVDMINEAEQYEGKPQREAYRHVGDFALYWCGFFPEMLRQLRATSRRDHLIDYVREGKRCYYRASEFDHEESVVLQQLSDEFELACKGLNLVRHELKTSFTDN